MLSQVTKVSHQIPMASPLLPILLLGGGAAALLLLSKGSSSSSSSGAAPPLVTKGAPPAATKPLYVEPQHHFAGIENAAPAAVVHAETGHVFTGPMGGAPAAATNPSDPCRCECLTWQRAKQTSLEMPLLGPANAQGFQSVLNDPGPRPLNCMTECHWLEPGETCASRGQSITPGDGG